ncbi:MAG: hypothetical protein H6968_09020 [Chromatiaceae bacterium]|nr:hypothetical protein [Chromatiaceae bacterium]
MDEAIIRSTPDAANTRYYHNDGLGSAVAVSDTLGAVQATARYDSWGNLLPGGGGIPQFGFTGREPDATGLTYFRARYYDPTLGRFTQRDPIGLAGGLNPYTYVSNSPQNFTDPLGLRQAAVTAGASQQTAYAGASSPGIVEQIARNAVVNIFADTESAYNAVESFNNGDYWKSAGFAALGVVNTFNPFSKMYRAVKGAANITRNAVGAVFGKVTRSGSGGGRTLYRAVGPGELADLQAKGQYRVPAGGTEGKYFFETPEQTSNFARMMGDQPYTTTSVRVSPSELSRGQAINPAREGPGYFFDTPDLPAGPVSIHNHSVLP